MQVYHVLLYKEFKLLGASLVYTFVVFQGLIRVLNEMNLFIYSTVYCRRNFVGTEYKVLNKAGRLCALAAVRTCTAVVLLLCSALGREHLHWDVFSLLRKLGGSTVRGFFFMFGSPYASVLLALFSLYVM